MVNNVIGVVNYVIAASPSLLNFMIADIQRRGHLQHLQSAGFDSVWTLDLQPVSAIVSAAARVEPPVEDQLKAPQYVTCGGALASPMEAHVNQLFRRGSELGFRLARAWQ